MSDYAGWLSSGSTGPEAIGKLWGKGFTPGVLMTSNTSAYQVVQHAAGANMTVDISVGAALLSLTDYSIPIWSSAVINATVQAADPTNPRNDIVVAYINLAGGAANNNLGATQFTVVKGIAAGSPSDPSSTTIQAQVGAGNPWLKLARITLPANAPSVLTAYITDLRVPVGFAGTLVGGTNNTVGHTIPNVTDDTVALLNAPQTFGQKTLSSPTISNPTFTGTPTYPNQWVPQYAMAQGYAGFVYVGPFANGGNGTVFTYRQTATTFSGLIVGRSYLVLSSIVGFYVDVANKNGYVALYVGSTQLAMAHIAVTSGTFQESPGAMMGIFTATATSQAIDIWCAVDSGATLHVDAMTVALI